MPARQVMSKKRTKDGDEDGQIQFTFRLPEYLSKAWRIRFRTMEFKVSNQAYLERLVENDLVDKGCIERAELEKLKEAEGE